MKHSAKYLFLLLLLILVLALAGCTYYPSPSGTHMQYNSSDGTVCTIDFNSRTIHYSGREYSFEANRDGGNLQITIHYPNGATYYSSGSNISWSDNYDPEVYAPGKALVERIAPSYAPVHKAPNGINIFACLFLLAIGAFGIFFPRTVWELEHLLKSWQYVSTDPSDAGLMMTRIGGILSVIVGIVLFFVGW